MERQRLARLAGITLTTAIAFEGCGAQSATNNPVTPEPTKSPDITIVVPTPAPSQTPEITQSPTAKPTPEATPTPVVTVKDVLKSIINAKHPKTQAPAVDTAIKNAYASSEKNKQTIPANFDLKRAMSDWDVCQHGFSYSKNIIADRSTSCEYEIKYLVELGVSTGNPLFKIAAQKEYNYIVNDPNMPPDFKAHLDGFLVPKTS